MNHLNEDLNRLLSLIQNSEQRGFIKEAEEAHNSLIRLSQQAQGDAYSFFDTSTIPPAIANILANLNYKVTQLTNTQQQMAQQMSGGGKPNNPQAKQILENQQNILQNMNQNTITPNTVNYIQTPGSTPAPISIDDGEINV